MATEPAALSQEDLDDYRDAFKNLSADELRAQMGDNAELDALIQAQLDSGKAVEMKVKPDLDDAHPNPDDVRHDPPAKANAGEDDNEEVPEVDEHGKPLVIDAAAAAQAAADAAAAAAASAPTAAPLVPLDLKFLDAEYGDKLAALNAEKTANFAKLMSGEMSDTDYAKFENGYFDQRDALREEKAAAATWYGTIHDFKAKALAESGINYDADPEKAQAWDDWVKRLAEKGVPDHEVLALAHKKVMAEFDVTPPAAAKPAAGAAKPVANGKNVAQSHARAPNLAAIPPTLGGIPAAASPDGSEGGEFGHLENLSGLAFEQAIARLNPEQRDRYGMGE